MESKRCFRKIANARDFARETNRCANSLSKLALVALKRLQL
jgi:hypothetical protein